MSEKRRGWLKVLWALGGLAFLLLLAAYISHLSAKSGLDHYREGLTAAGEELSFEKLIPPRIPSEQNSAELFQQVTNLMNLYPSNCLDALAPPAMQLVAPGKAMVGWRQPEVWDTSVTNTWEDLSRALAERMGAIDLLHDIGLRPHLAFDLEYREGASLLLPHLMSMKKSAQWLTAAAIVDLQRNNSYGAVSHNRALFAIVNAWSEEPLLISFLVRIACAAIGLNGTWEILQSPAVEDASLAALQLELERMDFISHAERALITERAYISMNVENLRGSNSPFSSMSVYGVMGGGSSGSGSGLDLEELWRDSRLRTKETLWKISFSYPDELRALKGCGVLIDSIRAIKTNAPFGPVLGRQELGLDALGLAQDSAEFHDIFGDPADFNPRSLISGSVAGLSKSIHRLMVLEVQRQLAITAIALKRYQQRHGRFPNDLVTLVPDPLKTVPRDPVNGKPLRYRLETDGSYTLYSVGEDGIDQGGDPQPEPPSVSLSWQRGRDWLWPRPATDAEIELYRHDVRARAE